MSTAHESGSPTKHTAGAFDIRNIIGALMALYGVILIGAGLVGDKGGPKTGDVNANLWAGIALLAVGVVFMAWAKLRPVVVDEAELARIHEQEGDRPTAH